MIRKVAMLMLSLSASLFVLSPSLAADRIDEKLAEEIRCSRDWAGAVFAKPSVTPDIVERPPQGNRLAVVHKSHAVLQGQTAWNTRLKLNGKVYRHGLYMDAPAAVLVYLEKPAKKFTAIVGIDDNEDTRKKPEKGTARFHVVVGQRKVSSSSLMRVGDEPFQMDVPLGGARRFVLEVDDGGNGRNRDQCTWANASVSFDDGTVRRLDELGPLTACPWRENPSSAPFSFIYGGRHSSLLLSGWNHSTVTRSQGRAIRQVTSYKDSETGLLIECHVTTHADAAGVDWVFHLTNTGDRDTPIIEQFLPLDTDSLSGKRLPKGSAILRWSNGDGCSNKSFLPNDEVLEMESPRRFQAMSSDTTCLPFFNLKLPDGGWILAIGWSGRWMADFLHQPDGRLAVRAGMQSTHFRLRPGERVRTPRILLMRYLGDEMIHGHNRFRRLMLDHYIQRRGGRPAEPPVAHTSVAGLYVRAKRENRHLARLNEQGELAVIQRAAKLGCETYWMDAYWYPQPWSANLGNWQPRPDDFPNGLKPLSDAAHRHGMKFLLWFAPFIARDDTQWANDYPTHIHGGGNGRGGLLKIGEPDTQKFVADWLNSKIREWGVDIYREDQGIGFRVGRKEKLPVEPPDRIGVGEMKHIEGFYNVWDDLLSGNPDLLIDNCCGGGRRIDLETNSRAFSLWRSDFNDIGQGLKGPEHWPMMGLADQVMVTGLSLYIPFHTGPAWDMRPYSFRSAMASGIVIYNDLDAPTFSDETARRAIAELKQLRPLFQGEIYPLMPLTLEQTDWYAYQLHRPDLGRGCAFFFRRPQAEDETRQPVLRQIDPDARYLVSLTGETYDHPEPKEVAGRELLSMQVRIEESPGSALLCYQRRSP